MFVPCARLLLSDAAPRSDETAVDVACGTGIVTRHLAPLLGEAGFRDIRIREDTFTAELPDSDRFI